MDRLAQSGRVRLRGASQYLYVCRRHLLFEEIAEEIVLLFVITVHSLCFVSLSFMKQEVIVVAAASLSDSMKRCSVHNRFGPPQIMQLQASNNSLYSPKTIRTENKTYWAEQSKQTERIP